MVFNSSIRYVNRRLTVDQIDIASIIAEVGTPAYIYSRRRIRENFHRLERAFAPLSARLHFSVKANGNLDILRALNEIGAGFDCVSGGEIYRALKAGAKARDIVFAGVGKTRDELVYAITSGVGWINAENLGELDHIDTIAAELGAEPVKVALRLNPEVTAQTHPYMATGHGAAKFGLAADVIRDVLSRPARYPRIDFAGLHMHIGSQLGDMRATLAAVDKLVALIQDYPRIKTINLGGGLPVVYRFDEKTPSPDGLAAALARRLRGYDVLLEPGRAIVADAGLLVAEALYVKRQAGQSFVVVDASMAELIRPALYGAHHEIVVLRQAAGETETTQVVGPVCESADVLGRDRQLPTLEAGDKVALMTAGAYGMTMASNYNARPRPVEVLVDGDRWWVSRRRETFDDLVRYELLTDPQANQKDPLPGPNQC
ncbi:MAG: diaminopimelate decarboxylase [Chloroflexota bacterium]|nr:diaminopimelate decarboxylase [Chloroflexota bacterium]MDE2909086.1 diaminopimelate decarboxylase [Chloroflexota bacterium]